MYSNTPITPQMAELGAAIVTAVEMIINNPDRAAQAAQAHLEALKLTNEQRQEANEALDLISRGDELRKELEGQLSQLEAGQAELKAGQAELERLGIEHAGNVEALNQAQRLHGDRVEKVAGRERQLEDGEQALAEKWNELRTREAAVEKREKAAGVRESAAREFANKLGGVPAA